MRHELRGEKLTVLPKRFETTCVALINAGSCINFAAVTQANASFQAQGVGVLSPQTAIQTNFAVVSQSN